MAAVEWTNVLVALIAGLPAIISAVGVLLVHRQIKTPSGTSIGKQVENTLHTALSNHYRLRAVGSTVSAPEPPESRAQEAHITEIPEGK